nr:MAG TPA: hypothetical protein [Caudoviricetes sp.]
MYCKVLEIGLTLALVAREMGGANDWLIHQ